MSGFRRNLRKRVASLLSAVMVASSVFGCFTPVYADTGAAYESGPDADTASSSNASGGEDISSQGGSGDVSQGESGEASQGGSGNSTGT